MRNTLIIAAFGPLLLAAGCALTAVGDPAAEPDPEFPDLDGGTGWSDDDGDAADTSDSDGDAGGADSGQDAGEDEDVLSCLEIGWAAYEVEGTCPGLPSTGAIEQVGCELAIPGALGEVIGTTGLVEGALVHTAACSGVATVTATPRVELTCLVDWATCTVELTGGSESEFD